MFRCIKIARCKINIPTQGSLTTYNWVFPIGVKTINKTAFTIPAITRITMFFICYFVNFIRRYKFSCL